MEVQDYGNIKYEPSDISVDNMAHLDHVAGCTQKLSEKVQQVFQDNRNVLTVGGDHSIGIGSIDGHVKVKKWLLFKNYYLPKQLKLIKILFSLRKMSLFYG